LAIKNKKILITAGPTWVAIDSVRVISNIASGESGILLAQKLSRLGAKVTLLLGPTEACCLDKKIKLLRFRFFDELKNRLFKELKSKRYDAVIHSAAVSDYRPALIFRQKIGSDKKNWKLSLVQTPKLIDAVKKIQRTVILVGFKFIPQAKKKILLQESRILLRRAKADLVVANTIKHENYAAFIVGAHKIQGPWLSKNKLTTALIKKIL
jgi:phosphopantothenoylcysteine decarboxylase/phosphopantothenate--cysteine ligase